MQVRDESLSAPRGALVRGRMTCRRRPFRLRRAVEGFRNDHRARRRSEERQRSRKVLTFDDALGWATPEWVTWQLTFREPTLHRDRAVHCRATAARCWTSFPLRSAYLRQARPAFWAHSRPAVASFRP